MATFVANTVDDGREICIGSDLFKHYTGLENHPETKKVVKEATCKEEGTQEVYCDTCKIVVRTEPIEKLEHTPGEWVIDEDASLVERIRCTVCDEILEEKEVDVSTKDVEQETVCNVHTYGDWQILKNASCQEAGERQKVCSICNDTVNESIASTGHSYSSWNTITAATCTTAGLQERICYSCGHKETNSLVATGHSVVYEHNGFAGDYDTNTFSIEYVGTCSTCMEQISSEIHTGTYSRSNDSPNQVEGRCSCGHTGLYSM